MHQLDVEIKKSQLRKTPQPEGLQIVLFLEWKGT